MNKFVKLLFFGLILFNLFFASWYVRHHDIDFKSDVARDFSLLKEVDEKKLVLIGPRSSVRGLFHGPLWLYIDYPGYVLGRGNPVIEGYWWLFLIILTLIGYYFMAKKLFGELSAWLFVLSSSIYLIYQANGLYNPHGAMFALPFFFFFFIRYLQTHKVQFLIYHVLIAGALIQFQMAVGIPFLLLSFLYLLKSSITNKKMNHLLAYFVILIPLSTFLLFDVRHNFLLLHSAFRHVQTHAPNQTLWTFVQDRIRVLISGTEFLRFGPANGTLYVGIFFFLFLLFELKNYKKMRPIYSSFLYFYVGFFVLSLANRYGLLYFYVFPLFLFVFLIFSSFANSKNKTMFLVIFFIVYAINVAGLFSYAQDSKNVIGKSEDSWKFLFNMSQRAFKGSEQEFGYFVYTPDVLGYGPKYAMDYSSRISVNKKAFSFEKKPVTYLIIAPPPRDNPLMKEDFWITNQVNIKSKPVETINFENGYKIEKYLLSSDEQKVPFDPSINPGIHFR